MRSAPSRQASARRRSWPRIRVVASVSAACCASRPSCCRLGARSISSSTRWGCFFEATPRPTRPEPRATALPQVRSTRSECTCRSRARGPHQAASDAVHPRGIRPAGRSPARVLSARRRGPTGIRGGSWRRRWTVSRASFGPTCPVKMRNVSPSPSAAPVGITGFAGSSSRPLCSTRTCPIRLPLSTVET